MEAINEKRIGNYLIEIFPDEYPRNPRDYGTFGTMVCFHKRYNLGDKHSYRHEDYDGWEEMKENIVESENVHTILPLYLYDHSGITISTSPFSSRWDSGQVGWMFVSKDKVKEEGVDENNVLPILEGELVEYDNYLTGEVYKYVISKITTCTLGHEHKEKVETGYEYYESDNCMAEAESVVEELLQKEKTIA